MTDQDFSWLIQWGFPGLFFLWYMSKKVPPLDWKTGLNIL